MVQPPHPWPKRPELEKHHSFELAALTRKAQLDDLQPFFCHGVPLGSMAHAVMTAAITGDLPALEAALSRKETLPDFANGHGLSPLMVACARGHAKVAARLAAHPLVNLNRQNADGWTALHYATWMQQKETMTLLLDRLADPLLENTAHKTALQLAQEQGCADVFVQNRAFRLYMKKHNHPLPGEEPADEEAAEDTTGKEPETPVQAENVFGKYISQMIIDLGISWQLGEDGLQKMYADIGGMTAEQLKKSFDGIEKTRTRVKNDFNWQGVFIAAATQDNAEVMRFLRQTVPMPENTVQRALYAVVAGKKDAASAMEHLMAWGADPLEPQRGQQRQPLDAAALSLKAGCLEAMALWHDKPCELQKHTPAFVLASGIRINKKGQLVRLKKTSAAVSETKQVLQTMRLKQDQRGKGARKLKKLFNEAVNYRNIDMAMAVYSEAQNDRFFRGRVTMESHAAQDAMALALLSGKPRFALRLARDGYRLSQANPGLLAELRAKAGEPARKIARDLLDNRVDLTPLEKIEPPASKNAPVVYPIFYGRGNF